MRDLRHLGLVVFVLLSVFVCVLFGPWPVLVYYGIGMAVGFAKCLFSGKRFIHPLNGALERRRLYRYGAIVAVLWPFVLLKGL